MGSHPALASQARRFAAPRRRLRCAPSTELLATWIQTQGVFPPGRQILGVHPACNLETHSPCEFSRTHTSAPKAALPMGCPPPPRVTCLCSLATTWQISCPCFAWREGTQPYLSTLVKADPSRVLARLRRTQESGWFVHRHLDLFRLRWARNLVWHSSSNRILALLVLVPLATGRAKPRRLNKLSLNVRDV